LIDVLVCLGLIAFGFGHTKPNIYISQLPALASSSAMAFRAASSIYAMVSFDSVLLKNLLCTYIRPGTKDPGKT
jgi:hypothetical protein